MCQYVPDPRNQGFSTYWELLLLHQPLGDAQPLPSPFTTLERTLPGANETHFPAAPGETKPEVLT